VEGDHDEESDLAFPARSRPRVMAGLQGESLLLLGQLRAPVTPEYSESDTYAPTTPSRTDKPELGADLL
jgi:hypothetical protein